jgi:hypothetical protein
VVEETAKTFIRLHETKSGAGEETTGFHRHPKDGRAADLDERARRLGHLWLTTRRTGEVKNQVTKGAWPVRRVVACR